MQPWRLAKGIGINYNAFKIMAALAKSDEPVNLRTISKLTGIARGEAADYISYLVWGRWVREHEGCFSLDEDGVVVLLPVQERLMISKLPERLRQDLLVEDSDLPGEESAREFDLFARRFSSTLPRIFGKWDYFLRRSVLGLQRRLLLEAIQHLAVQEHPAVVRPCERGHCEHARARALQGREISTVYR